MGLNETTRNMRERLAALAVDLEKAAGGNKAASQRVRTGTIRLEKIAKNYRKESIASEKSGSSRKQAKKSPAKAKAKAKPVAKAKQKAKPAPAKKAPAKKPMMMK